MRRKMRNFSSPLDPRTVTNCESALFTEVKQIRFNTDIFDHTWKSRTQTYRVCPPTRLLSSTYLRKENQCLLAFKAPHSHLLWTVFLHRNLSLTSVHIFFPFSFASLAIPVFFPNHHFGVFHVGNFQSYRSPERQVDSPLTRFFLSFVYDLRTGEMVLPSF